MSLLNRLTRMIGSHRRPAQKGLRGVFSRLLNNNKKKGRARRR